jgi:hypothetical protein
MKKNKINKLIYKSFDGSLDDKESAMLERYLLESDEIRKEYNRLNLIREKISGSAITSFKPFFEERVIAKINYPADDKDLLNNWTISLTASFRKVALVAMIILVMLVTYNLNKGNKYSIENLLGKEKISMENDFDPIHYLMWSEKQ